MFHGAQGGCGERIEKNQEHGRKCSEEKKKHKRKLWWINKWLTFNTLRRVLSEAILSQFLIFVELLRRIALDAQKQQAMNKLKTSIESITMEGNNKTYLKFVSHLKKERRTTYSFLNNNSLDGDEIGDEECEALSSALQNVNCKLTVL